MRSNVIVEHKEPPIMLRASITSDEWAAIRKSAIDHEVPNQDMVAALLRLGMTALRKGGRK